eukprot:TRINITY_DN66115_c0_g1_i1.p1 TRINITY_DN66115_c0_g1~~TRINITY_DN66115_c0_g1_i1.p1  ORF type:complete len:255 (-),score=53.84 TRINITY_DN66115_c0_g1_i1:125-889(-)
MVCRLVSTSIRRCLAFALLIVLARESEAASVAKKNEEQVASVTGAGHINVDSAPAGRSGAHSTTGLLRSEVPSALAEEGSKDKSLQHKDEAHAEQQPHHLQAVTEHAESHPLVKRANEVSKDGSLAEGSLTDAEEASADALREFEKSMDQLISNASSKQEALALQELKQSLHTKSDWVLKALDWPVATCLIIEDDYPFGCICDEKMQCANDMMQTPCIARAGTMGYAKRQASLAPAVVLFLVSAVLAGASQVSS